jgi:hypothetical protein
MSTFGDVAKLAALAAATYFTGGAAAGLGSSMGLGATGASALGGAAGGALAGGVTGGKEGALKGAAMGGLGGAASGAAGLTGGTDAAAAGTSGGTGAVGGTGEAVSVGGEQIATQAPGAGAGSFAQPDASAMNFSSTPSAQSSGLGSAQPGSFSMPEQTGNLTAGGGTPSNVTMNAPASPNFTDNPAGWVDANQGKSLLGLGAATMAYDDYEQNKLQDEYKDRENEDSREWNNMNDYYSSGSGPVNEMPRYR